MNVNIHTSWKTHLQDEFSKPYFTELVNFVKLEYKTHQCFPPGKEIFAAFDHCTFDGDALTISGLCAPQVFEPLHAVRFVSDRPLGLTEHRSSDVAPQLMVCASQCIGSLTNSAPVLSQVPSHEEHWQMRCHEVRLCKLSPARAISNYLGIVVPPPTARSDDGQWHEWRDCQ